VIEKDGAVRQIKITHSYPHMIAIRLLQAHREEVQAFRAAGAQRDGYEVVAARVRTHMELVRARLMGHHDGLDGTGPEGARRDADAIGTDGRSQDELNDAG
jgi:hypothetical protein